MAEEGLFETLVKLGLSAVAIWAFIVPEPASSAMGMAALFAIWGLDAEFV